MVNPQITLFIILLLLQSIILQAQEIDYRRPNFTMKDLQGVERSISEWDGNALLINFWATWCIPCKREIPMLNELVSEYEGRDFNVLGIAVDTPENIQEFKKTIPLEYETLADEDVSQDVAFQFSNSFLVLPFTVFLDHQGRIFWMQVEEIHREEIDLILDKIFKIRSGELDFEQAQEKLVAALDALMYERMAE